MSAPAASGPARALTVALGREVAPSLPEVTYTLRTLLRMAGFGVRFTWSDTAEVADLSYGRAPAAGAWLHIPASGRDFQRASEVDAVGHRLWRDLPFLCFPGEPWLDPEGSPVPSWPVDVVFAAFWFLTGAREAAWPRDRRDNLRPHDWLPVREGLLPAAPVSRWARAIRDRARQRGAAPLPMPWERAGARAAFSLTHDVDYPQIIRWIEAPRLVLQRGARGIRSAARVLRGTSHFWTFQEWLDLGRQLGLQSAFYFMARRGSLWRYATGTPDDFYDVRRPEFARLFALLREAGAEIGLHASFHAHRSAETIRVEAERVSFAAGVRVAGNRHHYWHLDPANPNETLRRHELAGLAYDSSLGLEYFPGFRRGTCHPFQPYHPRERRELDVLQVPPAWMDDHFDRRLTENRITDPAAVARGILRTAADTGGVVVVDYHSRGMNADIYPRYGPWLARFLGEELGAEFARRTPAEVAAEYRDTLRALEAVSSDATGSAGTGATVAPLEVREARRDELGAVAALHHELFGDADFNGQSIATLGPEFLERAFYGLTADDPHLHTLVAVTAGRVVGFFVYATRRDGLLARLARRHPLALGAAVLRSLVHRPGTLPAYLANLRYLGGEELPFLRDVDGWCVVIGVHPDARSARFEARVGARVATALFDAAEAGLRTAGCRAWYVAIRPDNAAVHGLLRRRGARDVGTATAQGLQMRYFVRRLDDVAPSERAD